jgi:uncharacterized membrane protein YkvA (DUF1232 family)
MTKNHNPIHIYSQRPDAGDILGDSFFRQIGDRTKDYIRDPRKAARVLGEVLNKSVDLGRDGAFDDLKDEVKTFGRMLNATLKGEYKRVPLKILVRVLAALIYFLFLEDTIRDYIPLLGLLDDAVVIAWVIRGIQDELDDFLAWEGN